MFDRNSPAVKIAGYAIIGFFVLIIIISFGMPDFMSRLGGDKSTAAVVNGEKLHVMDFIRFRDMRYGNRLKDIDKKEYQYIILENFVQYHMAAQLAEKSGMMVSDERVKKFIREIPGFQDQSGTFNAQYLKGYLDRSHQSLPEFYKTIKMDIMNQDFGQMLRFGAGATPDEVRAQAAIDSSKIQVRYCYASNNELKGRLKEKIAVTEDEVDAELKKNRTEVKDPKTDRERIRAALEDRKFEIEKKTIVDEIEKLAVAGKGFDEAAALLGGRTMNSAVFKIGEPVKEEAEKGTVLYALNDSPVFLDDVLAMGMGKTSRAVNSVEGVYIFTPLRRDVALKAVTGKDAEAVESRIMNEKGNALMSASMMAFRENSKIQKYLKMDDK
jgi:hypothetical protein